MIYNPLLIGAVKWAKNAPMHNSPIQGKILVRLLALEGLKDGARLNLNVGILMICS